MIQPGERYHYLDHWRAPRSFWCSDHRPRPSDMVTSPNKRRLYLAQERLIDASATGVENIIATLRLALIEASAVADRYAEWDSEKQEHVAGWIDELRRLLDALNAGDVDDPRSAVRSAAQRATIFDNWFDPEHARELGFG
jgi:hypothetical protein